MLASLHYVRNDLALQHKKFLANIMNPAFLRKYGWKALDTKNRTLRAHKLHVHYFQ